MRERSLYTLNILILLNLLLITISTESRQKNLRWNKPRNLQLENDLLLPTYFTDYSNIIITPSDITDYVPDKNKDICKINEIINDKCRNGFMTWTQVDELKSILLGKPATNKVIQTQNIKIQYTSIQSQLDSDIKSLSSINFGSCLNKIENQVGTDSLNIFKVDILTDSYKTPYVIYEVYKEGSATPLNLDVCTEEIIINTPVFFDKNMESIYKYLSEEGIDMLNSGDDFYQDICTPYTTIYDTDITINDRKDYYFKKNEKIYMCQKGCKFESYNYDTKKAKCICRIKSETVDDLNENAFFIKKNISKDFYDDVDNINFKVMKCTDVAFSEDYKKNIGGIIMIIITLLVIIVNIISIVTCQKKIKLYINIILRRPFDNPVRPFQKNVEINPNNNLINSDIYNIKKKEEINDNLENNDNIEIYQNNKKNKNNLIINNNLKLSENKSDIKNENLINEDNKEFEEKKPNDDDKKLEDNKIEKNENINNNQINDIKEKEPNNELENNNNEINIENNKANLFEFAPNINNNLINNQEQINANNNENNNNINKELIDNDNKDIKVEDEIKESNENEIKQENNANSQNNNQLIDNEANQEKISSSSQNNQLNDNNDAELKKSVKKIKKKKKKKKKGKDDEDDNVFEPPKKSRSKGKTKSDSNSLNQSENSQQKILNDVKHSNNNNIKISQNSLKRQDGLISSSKNKKSEDKLDEVDDNKNTEIGPEEEGASYKYNSKILSDYELDNLDYQTAIELDKRTYLAYYWSLCKRKHILLYVFWPGNYFNILMIKIGLFIAFIGFCFGINGFFYGEKVLHNLFINEGTYKFGSHLPHIIYSTIVAGLLTYFIRLLSKSENEIFKIKQNKNDKNVEEQTKKCIKIKFILFFVLSIVLNVFFWYFITCFCAVFTNSQVPYIIDSCITIVLCLVYPFILNLLPGAFRIPALRAKKKDRSTLYDISLYVAYI